MSTEIFDTDELLDEYENDFQMLRKMMEIFERDAHVRIPKLRSAVIDGDCTTLMEEAHAIKGGLATFFAIESYETAYVLENMGRDKSIDAASETLQKFESQLNSFRQAVNELIHSNGQSQ